MRKNRLFFIALLCLSLFGLGGQAWAQDRPQYIKCEWDGTKVVSTTTNPPMDVIHITGSNSGETVMLEKGKWYFISGTVERKRLVVPHDATEYAENPVHIILGDGAVLKSVITFRGYFPGLHHEDEITTGILHIHAQSDGANMGKLIANARDTGDGARNITDCAGIGGTDEDNTTFDHITTNEGYDSHHGGRLYIHGGDITAWGNKYAAGIGGGDAGNGGEVYIYGGKVTTDGGEDAAGIGGGEGGNGGKLFVYGGYVYADGTNWGAGIGGGEDGDGAEVHILGGTVIASAGNKAGEDGGLAIGGGDAGEGKGSLEIGHNMMVHAGQNVGDANNHLFPYGTRVPACWYRPYARIEPCDHQGKTYTVSGTTANDTHKLNCTHCLDRTEEKHNFVNNECTVCGVSSSVSTVSIYLPEAVDGTYTEGRYASTPHTEKVITGTTISLPAPPVTYLPNGVEFAGWAVGTPTDLHITRYWKEDGETIYAGGSEYTVSHDVSLTARYTGVNITLADDADNGETLYLNNGKTAQTVTLTGRTLYKNDKWNTICLPFDYTAEQIAKDDVFAGAQLMTLSESGFISETGELTLTFTEATSITAGVPYLVKWASGSNIESPISFTGVVINNTPVPATSTYIDFVGIFSPETIYREADENTKLYLGSDNTLYYPNPTAAEATGFNFKVNSFRAYFQLKDGLTAGSPSTSGNTEGSHVRAFNLNFGDDNTNGISDAEANSSLFTHHSSLSSWYDLSGRLLSGKPVQKGIYVKNGKKIIVK